MTHVVQRRLWEAKANYALVIATGCDYNGSDWLYHDVLATVNFRVGVAALQINHLANHLRTDGVMTS